MKILQLISSEGFYGAESMLLALARTLPGLGCSSIVGVFGDGRQPMGELEKRAREAGLQVEAVCCEGRWDRQAIARIRELMGTEEVAVLHTHGYKADIYGYAANRKGQAALVATCHNWPSKLPSMRAYAAVDRLALRHFDRVASASEAVLQKLKQWKVPESKLKSIPNGVDLTPFRAARPAGPRAEQTVGFVGRLVPDKGGATLIEAAAVALREFPNAKFVFAGEGPAREAWQALAARLGIASQVEFVGRCEDMATFYAGTDMVILPSYQEAMPMCLLEALAAGKPVAATTVGAIPTVIVAGVTGLLSEPGDAAGLARNILELLRDTPLARRIGQQGRAHVVRHFSAEVVARSYVGLYQEALGSRCTRPNVSELLEQSR